MFENGIRIDWRHGPEFVPINTSKPAESNVTSTLEFVDNNTFVTYATTSRVDPAGRGNFKISVFYEHSANSHISRGDSCWGRSEIHISAGATSGHAYWHDDDDRSYNGKVKWKALESGFTSERKRVRVTRIQREQELFRAALLAIEPKCAISGERSKHVLEAAHVFPAHKGGREIVGNGLILRADLHRLLDRGIFRIDPNGCVVVVERDSISQSYLDLLDGARLPHETIKRIARALTYFEIGS